MKAPRTFNPARTKALVANDSYDVIAITAFLAIFVVQVMAMFA